MLTRAWRTAALLGQLVSPAGRAVAIATVASWWLGTRLGWAELMYLSAACLTVLLVGALFTLGRLRLAVRTDVVPRRVVTGRTARAQISVHNAGPHRSLPCTVEVTIGSAVVPLTIPALAPDAELEQLVEIPASRRGVIPVGPARTLRQDPLGLLRRSLAWPQVTDLFVHPRTARFDGFSAGVLRDLEGRATRATSMSDIELHALREYVPGDDRRFVHWRSSARRTDGALMVRQFVDSRRSHLAVVMAGRPRHYASEEEFELGISVLASLALRGIQDQHPTTVLALGRRLSTASGQGLLDATSALHWGRETQTLAQSVQQLGAIATGVTLALLVIGSAAPDDELRAAVSRFAAGVQLVVVRVEAGAPSGVQPASTFTLITAGALDDLPKVLRAVAQ